MYFPIIITPNAIQQIKDMKVATEKFDMKIPNQPGLKPKDLDKNLIVFQIVALLALNIILILFLKIQSFLFFLIVEFLATTIYYSRMIGLYNKGKKQYQQKVQIYEMEKKEYKRYKNQHQFNIKKKSFYKTNLILNILQKTETYNSKDSNHPKGYSEEGFLKYLQKYFPGKIHTNLKLIIPSSTLYYHPDFAYIDLQTGLHIDIEVDEPYFHKTKKPTHFLNSDNNRNSFFSRKGWIVIRFSERQVIMQTRSCCKTIATIIAETIGDEKILDKFDNIPNLKKEKQWTFNEATKMAKRNSRKEYLLK